MQTYNNLIRKTGVTPFFIVYLISISSFMSISSPLVSVNRMDEYHCIA